MADAKKLFVWLEPYSAAWGMTMVFAIAENVEEARKVCATGKAYEFFSIEQDNPSARADLTREPDRIVDLPCAEWHEWSD